MKNIFKPMLFSTPMVQAILDGTKTQTRRTKGIVINDEPDNWIQNPDFSDDGMFIFRNSEVTQGYYPIPPYEKGDIIWVRETFYKNTADALKGTFYYKASVDKGWNLKFKPSIHMPKEACRIFLKVKSIRIERLNEISDNDAIAEGIEKEKYCLDENIMIYQNYLPGKNFYSFSAYGWNYGKETHSAPVASFCSLWEDINGDGSWNKNPWVWVIEFERIDKPEDFLL